MTTSTFFITGTDTGVGKTIVTAGLLAAAHRYAWQTVALKPVAAGCTETPHGLRNDDALLLQQTMSVDLPYVHINPVALAPPIAPSIAAQQTGQPLSVASLLAVCQPALVQQADLTLIEGAGGWLVPLNQQETLADFAQALAIPVILVVAMRLGCINHALLTAEAIQRKGLSLAGWVANRVDSVMPCYNETLATLKTTLTAPCWGEVPYLSSPYPDSVADYLQAAWKDNNVTTDRKKIIR